MNIPKDVKTVPTRIVILGCGQISKRLLAALLSLAASTPVSVYRQETQCEQDGDEEFAHAFAADMFFAEDDSSIKKVTCPQFHLTVHNTQSVRATAFLQPEPVPYWVQVKSQKHTKKGRKVNSHIPIRKYRTRGLRNIK
jgi:hypothetical protein